MNNVSESYKAVLMAYKVLSKEEEMELRERERGNEEKLRDLLMYHNMRLAVSIAMKYATNREDSVEDAIQRAMIGLFHASRDFDLSSDVRFLSYASWKVIAAVQYPFRNEINDARVSKSTVSLDAPVSSKMGDSADDALTMMDVVNQMAAKEDQTMQYVTDNVLIGSGFREIVNYIVDSLVRFSQKKKDIYKAYVSHFYNTDNELDGRIRDGRTTDVSKIIGVSREYVRQVVEEIGAVVRMKLKMYYSEEEEIAALISEHNRHKMETQFCSDEYLEATGRKKELEEEEKRIEAVKKEKENRCALLARLKESLYAEEFARAGISNLCKPIVEEPEQKAKPDIAKPPVRSGCRVMDPSRFAFSKPKKMRNVRTYWIPQRKDDELKSLYAFERFKYRQEHPMSTETVKHERLRSITRKMKIESGVQPSPADVPAVKPNTPFRMPKEEKPDFEEKQENFNAELDERFQRMREELTANGNHFDDQFETTDLTD